MARARGLQQTRRAGVHRVFEEMSRRGLRVSLSSGSSRDYPILLTDSRRSSQPVWVKTTRKGNWQFDARRFVAITVTSDGRQIVGGKVHLELPDLLCVFARLAGARSAEFYVFRQRDLQDIVYENYKAYLKQHGGRRVVNPQTTHIGISTLDLARFRENWDMLTS